MPASMTRMTATTYAWADSCVRPDKNFVPQPSLCTELVGLRRWSDLDLQDGSRSKVWSDDTPITANDMVFTFQRFARPDYDFEWFYSMANIVNWGRWSAAKWRRKNWV
jgi:hypothetical protein